MRGELLLARIDQAKPAAVGGEDQDDQRQQRKGVESEDEPGEPRQAAEGSRGRRDVRRFVLVPAGSRSLALWLSAAWGSGGRLCRARHRREDIPALAGSAVNSAPSYGSR